MLEELLDSLRLIDLGICLVIEGGWFEEVCMYVCRLVCQYLFCKVRMCLYISSALCARNLLFLDLCVW